jgi:cyclophilin family peptidyl-prolyl cis-trans isomerase
MLLSHRARTVIGQLVESLETRQLLAAPVLDAIPNQTAPAGKTIQIPLTATDSDGDALAYTITDSNSNITESLHPHTNTFLKLNTSLGSMTFELFDDVAPNTVATIKGLVNAGFYNGLTFHRVVKDFVIQGGDPAGNGTGGPGFQFKDEFNPNVIFSGDAQLAMANSGKDTNGSQFFVTVGQQRALDFNHTIFGQLIHGHSTLTAIDNVATDSNDAPVSKVTINSAQIIQDKTDAVLQIKVGKVTTGTITVKVDDGHGGTSTKQFQVSGVSDTVNDPPILGSISNRVVSKGVPFSIQVPATDLEGDDYEVGGSVIQGKIASSAISGHTVSITPAAGYTGPIVLRIGVKQTGATSRGSTGPSDSDGLAIYDTEIIQFGVGDKPVSGTGVAITAAAQTATRNAVVATFTDADANGTASNWASTINWGDGGTSKGVVVKNDDGTFSVLGSHQYNVENSFPLQVVIDGDKGAIDTVTGTANVLPIAKLNGNILTINGTSGEDNIAMTVSGGILTVNETGKRKTFPNASVARIELNAYEGNDVTSMGSGIAGAYQLGGEGNDTLGGGDGKDTLTGSAGRDLIMGNGGDDRLNGLGTHDTIFGGAGNDRLYGGDGNDRLDGGDGIDRLYGEAGNDFLIGGSSNDRLTGDIGNDTLQGNKGSDIYDGGPGTDKGYADATDQPYSSIEILA